VSNPPAVPEAPAAAAPGTGTSTEFVPDRSTSGLLTILVPADAKVVINGLQTKSTGSKREYVSYGLKPGFSYKYVIEAEVVRDGKVVRETKEVALTAGATDRVAFGFAPQPAEQVAQRF
jgi:uncharacterized protein (TIGR03000 family)